MDNLFYLIDGNPSFRQFKLSDTLFTEYKCPEERTIFDIWSHLNYFVYVLSGKMEWQTQQSSYQIHSGDSIFVKKGGNIVHKYFEEDFCSLIIMVSDEFIRTVIREHPLSLPADRPEGDDSVIPLVVDARLNAFFQSLFAYFFAAPSPPKALLHIKFKELILNLISSHTQKESLRYYFRLLGESGKLSIPEIMEQNFTYHLSLREYAQLCGRSLSTFKRDFRDHYRLPPGKWLKKRRLKYSLHLLDATDMTVNEIAFTSGFANTSHFIQEFKKVYGKPPLRFKRSHLQRS